MAEEKKLKIEIFNDDKNAEKNDESSISKSIKFPREFEIKVIGLNDPALSEVITQIMKNLIPDFVLNIRNIDFSGGKKYESITFSFIAESQNQVEKIYKDLASNKMIKWVI